MLDSRKDEQHAARVLRQAQDARALGSVYSKAHSACGERAVRGEFVVRGELAVPGEFVVRGELAVRGELVEP